MTESAEKNFPAYSHLPYQRRPDNDGMAWRFWQHSDRGQVDGINGPVDFNVFNGTVEELQAFVDGIKETP
ncbi:TPA: hypothetical protein JLO29_000038 [Escherichia coli]|nr:hypothetical protein [Escherichia coli]HCB3339257.1 hypothetical protein [Escherichia coli]